MQEKVITFKKLMFKKAFTMIELIFVIVVLGILSIVAIPRLGGVTDDANLAQAMATVSSIRSAIATQRERNIIKGDSSFPIYLDDTPFHNNILADTHQNLFDGDLTFKILQYPIYSKAEKGGWMKASENGVETIYNFYLNTNKLVTFRYNNSDGTFDCDHADTNCQDITE
jgi:general secretion pathway protein G